MLRRASRCWTTPTTVTRRSRRGPRSRTRKTASASPGRPSKRRSACSPSTASPGHHHAPPAHQSGAVSWRVGPAGALASAGITRHSRYRAAGRAVDGVADPDVGTTRTLAPAIAPDRSRRDPRGEAPIVAATQCQLVAPLVSRIPESGASHVTTVVSRLPDASRLGMGRPDAPRVRDRRARVRWMRWAPALPRHDRGPAGGHQDPRPPRVAHRRACSHARASPAATRRIRRRLTPRRRSRTRVPFSLARGACAPCCPLTPPTAPPDVASRPARTPTAPACLRVANGSTRANVR